VLSSDYFIDVMKHPEKSITCKIETGRVEQIRKNRQNISPIIETVILCGKQNIPLRGHRDSGKLIVEQENDNLMQNQGNFREILRYRAQGYNGKSLPRSVPRATSLTAKDLPNSAIVQS
jgi:hypothetical protein